MKTYNQLKREFKQNVKRLQNRCLHKKTTWTDEGTGYQIKICKVCTKLTGEMDIADYLKPEFLKTGGRYDLMPTPKDIRKK